MPLYEYAEAGRVVERVLPIEQRDAYPHRITVPARITVPRGLQHPGSVAAGGPQALRELEIKHGGHGDRLAREMGFGSAEQIRRIWEPELKAR